MLATSRLYSFLDHKKGVNIHFLEGQKLINDLVITHPMKSQGFSYFRDTFLGLMPIVFFLKPGESLGIYIDSEDPYFRLKIETNSAGHTRTLLLPEEFDQFPETITGQIRVTKIHPGSSPYTSMLELNKTSPKELINRIFTESYQTNSEVIVSQDADQSIMVTKLPPVNVNSIHDEEESRKEYILKNMNFFNETFKLASNDIEEIVRKFESNNLSYLGSRQVDFFCPCNKERTVLNLKGLYASDIDYLFQKDPSVEVKCDYCRKVYNITKSDLLAD